MCVIVHTRALKSSGLERGHTRPCMRVCMFGSEECEGGEGGHATSDIPLIPKLISTLGTEYIHRHQKVEAV